MNHWNDTEYTDDRGAIVVERKIFDTQSEDVHPEVKIFGKGMVKVATPQGEFPQEFLVELDVSSVAEGFDNFTEQMNEKAPPIAEAEAKKIQDYIKEQMRNQSQSIVTPDQIAHFDPNIRK